MNVIQALGVISMSFDLWLYLWPVSIIVVVSAFFGVRALVTQRLLTSWQPITTMLCLVIPAVVVPLFATAFWADHGVDTPETQEAPVHVLAAIQIVFFLVLGFAVAMSRGFRLPVAGLAIAVAWFGLGVFFVSAMAVSGVWM